MATVCKLYRDTPQAIPPNTWTLLTFDEALRNDYGMAQDLTLIVPPQDGDFIWGRNIRWEPITIPEGDTRPRQFMARFVRDPHGVRDDTGAAGWDRYAGPGLGYDRVAFPAATRAFRSAWRCAHDHHEAAVVGHAQSAAQTERLLKGGRAMAPPLSAPASSPPSAPRA